MKTRFEFRAGLLIMVLAVSTPLLVHRAAAGIYAQNCMSLDIPGGRYYLTGQISDSPINTPLGFGACLWIKADGITLHLYELTMTGPGDQVGILVTASHVTIEDSGVISHYRVGIVLATGSGNTVNGVTLSSNTEAGVMIGYCCPASFGSDNNLVRANNIVGAGTYGVLVANSRGSTISRNNITGTLGSIFPAPLPGGIAIGLINSTNSLVERNRVTGNTNGLFADASSGSTQIDWNQFSYDQQSGVVMLSSSNVISDNNVSYSGIHGISVAGSSNQIGHDNVHGDAGRGIGLGAVCVGTTVYSAGDNNSIVSDTATVNGADYFWDGLGALNVWQHDTATTLSTPIPITSTGC